MGDLFWLTEDQLSKMNLSSLCPMGGLDDRKVASGIIFVIKTGCAGEMQGMFPAALAPQKPD